jgi:hypothetical protein
VGNYIAGNGPDGDVGTTTPTGISILGTTPITGLVISGNVIQSEDVGVAAKSNSTLELHLNDLGVKQIGVANLSSGGVVNASENWWGCSGGPAAKGCSTISGGVIFAPWLTNPSHN